MLPDAAWHCGTFVFADEVVAITMLDAYGWDALQANLSESINEGVDSLAMPDDGTIRESHLHALRHVLNTLCGLMRSNFFWFFLTLYRRAAGSDGRRLPSLAEPLCRPAGEGHQGSLAL